MEQERLQFDPDNLDHQLIVAAIANMAEQGITPHQIFGLLDDIKQKTAHALREISGEARS